jgi:hypothetical protein
MDTASSAALPFSPARTRWYFYFEVSTNGCTLNGGPKRLRSSIEPSVVRGANGQQQLKTLGKLEYWPTICAAVQLVPRRAAWRSFSETGVRIFQKIEPESGLSLLQVAAAAFARCLRPIFAHPHALPTDTERATILVDRKGAHNVNAPAAIRPGAHATEALGSRPIRDRERCGVDRYVDTPLAATALQSGVFDGPRNRLRAHCPILEPSKCSLPRCARCACARDRAGGMTRYLGGQSDQPVGPPFVTQIRRSELGLSPLLDVCHAVVDAAHAPEIQRKEGINAQRCGAPT